MYFLVKLRATVGRGARLARTGNLRAGEVPPVSIVGTPSPKRLARVGIRVALVEKWKGWLVEDDAANDMTQLGSFAVEATMNK